MSATHVEKMGENRHVIGTGGFDRPIAAPAAKRNSCIIIMMSKHTFKVGDWVWDGDDYGSIVSIDESDPDIIMVDLFDGKEGWTADLNEIMPDRA